MCVITLTITIITITIITIIIAIIAIIDSMNFSVMRPSSPKRMKRRSVEGQLWRLLQQVPADQRRRTLETLSQSQRMELERWVLSDRNRQRSVTVGNSRDARGKPSFRKQRRSHGGKTQRGGGRTGIPGICSHLSAGRLRYDARVSCWPFRLCTRMSCDLEMVLKELKLLNSVKQRFEAAVQECSWRCGTGSRAMRDFRWQCFTDAVVAELHDTHDVDTENFRFEACVPTHFLLGRQLHTPMFPVTSAGLSGGWSAYGALYGALAVGSKSRGKRRNRFSSVRCGMSAEEVQETWQRLRSVYSSVWMAAGQSSKRLEAHLATLERHFGSRRNDMFPTAMRSSQDAEKKIEKLLQRWNKRKPSGSKR